MNLDAKSRLVRWAYWPDKEKTVGYLLPDGTIAKDWHEMFEYQLRHPDRVCEPEPVRSNIPAKTSLCRFFWRAFVIIPLISPFVVLAMAAVSAAFGVSWVFRNLPKVRPPSRVTNFVEKATDVIEDAVLAIKYSVFIQGLKSLKHSMCPIITFENREKQ